MGSDESHFNVSEGSDGQSHKTVSTNHNLSEEKGVPKRYRTEVLPLTSLTPYRLLAIAQRLVHCAIAVSTAVLGRVARTMSVALTAGANVRRACREGADSWYNRCPWSWRRTPPRTVSARLELREF